MRRQRCRCRRADFDVAGAPQVVHFPDPVDFDTVCLSKLSQGHRDGRVRIQGQVDPCDSALEQLLSKLLHSDDQFMVPKLCKFAGTRRTPYIHGIHTNQYYTRFSEKVNVFLLKNPLFLNPTKGPRMCKMTTRYSRSMHGFPGTYSQLHIAIFVLQI